MAKAASKNSKIKDTKAAADAKNWTKVIRTVRSPKSGSYTFKESIVHKDKIKELERLLKDCADELSLNIAYCKNAPTIKNRAWQLHDKIRNVIGED